MIEPQTRLPFPNTFTEPRRSELPPTAGALSGEQTVPLPLLSLSAPRALACRALLNGRSQFPRCSSKGCVFPAAEGRARCWQHELEELEPMLFLSCQPTHVLVDLARFGEPEEEFEDSRARDRRRLAALREQFLEDVA